MEELCSLLLSCNIDNKPVLYDNLIFDFSELSRQYMDTESEYVFQLHMKYKMASFGDINEIISYIQQQNCEEILIRMIKQRYGDIFIDRLIIMSMIDYYLNCLIESIN